MYIPFVKYQSTGNDFILIEEKYSQLSRAEIAKLCDRRMGVGADGLIVLEQSNDYDFVMKNYNSDGGECSMCGNGARALVKFAVSLGLKPKIGDHFRFMASDGPHEAKVVDDQIHLKMQDVKAGTPTPLGLRFETGSPHLVCVVNDLMNYDVLNMGRKLRNSPLFAPTGVNINYTEMINDQLFIRTFERGVEDETLSCGTGVIAAALAFNVNHIQTLGGKLEVKFQKSGLDYTNVWLIGPSEKTFEGIYS